MDNDVKPKTIELGEVQLLAEHGGNLGEFQGEHTRRYRPGTHGKHGPGALAAFQDPLG